MGGDGLRRHPGGGGSTPLTSSGSVRVVPAIPTFAVDDGFWYSVPAHLEHVDIGSIVRVPLGGRRVRGYVVERGSPRDGLRPVASRSGAASIFDSTLLDSLTWASAHYVAPLSVLLDRAAPPNVPPAAIRSSVVPRASNAGGPFADLAGAAIEGRRHPPVAWVDSTLPFEHLAALASRLREEGGSLTIVVPTAVEVAACAREIGRFLTEAVHRVAGDEDARSITEAWTHQRHHGGVLIGTPRVAAWMMKRPAVITVVEEGRRAMKDRQTPTVSVRDLARARGMREKIPLLFCGPTPTVELLGWGAEVRRPAGRGRAWPLVEVIDRKSESPGTGLLGEQARRALQAVTGAGGRVFVFAHRRGYSAAVRCAQCRKLRTCPHCGARPDPGDSCQRCGEPLGGCTTCGGRRFEPLGAGVGRLVEEAGRVVGRDRVAAAPAEAPVIVGTERDLVGLPQMDLVVLVDADGLVYASHYRAAEEALRIGARLARQAGGGSGRRLMVQTNDPHHPVIESLRRGDPFQFLVPELAARERFGYPPAGDLLLLALKGDLEEARVTGSLQTIGAQATIMGPAEGPDGQRWLVQGADLTQFKRDLRAVVQRWRESGLTVRIDVDPIDL